MKKMPLWLAMHAGYYHHQVALPFIYVVDATWEWLTGKTKRFCIMEVQDCNKGCFEYGGKSLGWAASV